MEKTCSMCNVSKSLEEFHKNKTATHGRTSRCKKCTKDYWDKYYKTNYQKYRDRTKQWRIDNPEAFQDQSLKQKYNGFSYADYESMLNEQNGVCAICKNKETRNRNGKVYRLHIDHDHSTGRVRKLLCHHCNAGLGHFQDDPNLLQLAADYLESHRSGL